MLRGRAGTRGDGHDIARAAAWVERRGCGGRRRVDDWEWLRMLVPVVAVSVGFVLGQWDSWRRDRRAFRGARVLLRLEIDDNLEEVRRYRSEAADRALEEMLPPAWQKEGWTSQLGVLATTLEIRELARVRRFYQLLDLLAEHHQRARAASDDPLIQAREVGAAEEISGFLVRSGNPLEERRSGGWWRRVPWPTPSRAR